MKEIRERIRTLRKVKGYSQLYMSQQLHISQRAYSSLENGHTKISLIRAVQIAKILEVSMDALTKDIVV